MPDSTTPIIVPADVRAKFGELVDLIVTSESMNDDERRYWIDILPVMNDDQVSKLRDILARERDQLAAIDAKYAKDMTRIADAQSIQALGEARKQRNDARAAGEAEARAHEEKAAEGLLDQMGNV